jgi:AraC-like DNA-binding protein
MDALSELLRAVKLSGAVFFDARCAAPWCLRSPPSQAFSRHVAWPSGHVIEFHLVAEGRGYVRLGDHTTPLVAGDIVMIPHGDVHEMGNGSGALAIDGEATLPALLTGPLALSRLGGSGEETRLICGFLACEARLIQPLLSGLPQVVRVNVRSDAYGELLEKMIRQAVELASAAEPGGGVIVARMAEVLFVEVLRRHVLQMPPGRTGWLAGAADPIAGRALAALHREPARAWTLDELSREAGTSRSTLAERFAACIGQGPMAYLGDWRLELAAEALRTTSRSVLRIATDVGYESEAAFNRAFKRRFAEPPGRYRRQCREGR